MALLIWLAILALSLSVSIRLAVAIFGETPSLA